MTRVLSLIAIVLLTCSAAAAQAASPDENAAITKTALNYIEGWYEGDAARMESALHPELAKRMIYTDAKSGRSQFHHMGAMALVQGTKRGGGKQTPKEQQCIVGVEAEAGGVNFKCGEAVIDVQGNHNLSIPDYVWILTDTRSRSP